MASVTKMIPEFPSFAAHYDPLQKPFFEANLVEDLRKLASKPLGKQLLEMIAAAQPQNRNVKSARPELQGIEFPLGINVMCVPTMRDFTQSGSKRDMRVIEGKIVNTLVSSAHKAHNPDGCTFFASGGSMAVAADNAFESNGKGSVSIMYYTNAQTFSQGAGEREHTWPYIVLAHELIHSLHHVLGTKNGSGEEEHWTTGLGKFIDEPMSENKMRVAFGHPLRRGY